MEREASSSGFRMCTQIHIPTRTFFCAHSRSCSPTHTSDALPHTSNTFTVQRRIEKSFHHVIRTLTCPCLCADGLTTFTTTDLDLSAPRWYTYHCASIRAECFGPYGRLHLTSTGYEPQRPTSLPTPTWTRAKQGFVPTVDLTNNDDDTNSHMSRHPVAAPRACTFFPLSTSCVGPRSYKQETIPCEMFTVSNRYQIRQE